MSTAMDSRQQQLSRRDAANPIARQSICELSDDLAIRQYLKNDQSAHRRFHHLYEDLLM